MPFRSANVGIPGPPTEVGQDLYFSPSNANFTPANFTPAFSPSGPVMFSNNTGIKYKGDPSDETVMVKEGGILATYLRNIELLLQDFANRPIEVALNGRKVHDELGDIARRRLSKTSQSG